MAIICVIYKPLESSATKYVLNLQIFMTVPISLLINKQTLTIKKDWYLYENQLFLLKERI